MRCGFWGVEYLYGARMLLGAFQLAISAGFSVSSDLIEKDGGWKF